MKKIFITLLFVVAILCFHTIDSNAATIQPTRPICAASDYWYYSVSTETHSSVQTIQHTHTNPNEYEAESVYYSSVSRRFYTEATVSTEYKFDLIVSEATYGNEVTLGTDYTTTVSMVWVIEPGVTKTLRAGYRYQKINGNLEHYDIFCNLISSSYEEGEWSYESWSDSIIQ